MDPTFFQHKLNTLRARIANIREFQKQYEKELRLAVGSPVATSKWKELIKGLKRQLEQLSEEHELLVQQIANIPQESFRSEASEHISQMRYDIRALRDAQDALLSDGQSAIAPEVPEIDLHEQSSPGGNLLDPGQQLEQADVQLKLNALRQRMKSFDTSIEADPNSVESDRPSQPETVSPNPLIPQQEPAVEIDRQINLNSGPGKEDSSRILSNFRIKITRKTSNPYVLIEQVRKWTGDQPFLTDVLCQLILEYPAPIPLGQEEALISQIVQDKIIRNWQNKAASAHLELIQQSLLDHEESTSLLSLYTEILQQGEVLKNDNNQYQNTLLATELVRAEQGKLKVANDIYEAIFNLEWASRKPEYSPSSLPTITPALPHKNDRRVTQSTRLWSLSVLLLIPIFAVLYSLRPKAIVTPLPSPIPQPTSADLGDSNLCTSNAVDQESQLNQLVARKERDKESFPQACQAKLDQLFYVTGLEKARGDDGAESNFNEGVRRLCKVSEEGSDYFITARSQLNAWYSSEQHPEFKQFIINYLNVLKAEGKTCPAAKDISL
jgi:hypothetical protein